MTPTNRSLAFHVIRAAVLLLAATLALASAGAAEGTRVPLFDGKTLDGWEGNRDVWRVEDGAIVGGSMEGNPHNEYLALPRSYKNFILRLEFKLVGTEGFVNGGVQIRSRRVPGKGTREMSGFQADIGHGYTGSLYDEIRRNKFVASANKALIQQIEKVGDWNSYEIRCEGPRIQLWINGRRTVDYTERNPGWEDEGLIALQIHGKCKAVISYRDITIEKLPDDIVPPSDEILARLTPDPAPARPAAIPASTLGANELIVTMGGGGFDRDSRDGWSESILAATFADLRPRFRPMTWNADTVYEQWREANFGSWRDQLEAVKATRVIMQFGQMESLDGPKRLKEFITAYTKLLSQVPAGVKVMLLTPTPFEPVSQGLDQTEAARRNAVVEQYCAAIRQVADQTGAQFVDVYSPLKEFGASGRRLTSNGVHLTPEAGAQVAGILARALGAARVADASAAAGLREAIVQKNRSWFECWRPGNWSFAYGERTTWGFGRPAGTMPSLHELFARHGAEVAKLDAGIFTRASEVGDTQAVPGVLPEFTLRPGFEAKIFADERLGVVKPTQIAWDYRGRLFVACSPSYPQLLPGQKPHDFILLLEDTDGDGQADRSTRYAEGLTMVMGVEPAGDGIYVCDYDQLLLLRDTDGDNCADQREVVFSGFGTGDTHHLINSVTRGPDGSIWFSQGLHAHSRVETVWGPRTLKGSGIWRYRPRTGRLESFFNGSRGGYNIWGVAFDAYGQMFHKSGDRPAGYYTIPGLVRIDDPDEYHPTGALFDSNAKTTALELVKSPGFSGDLQGCALIGGFFDGVVEVHRIFDDGAGFRSEKQAPLIASKSVDFRPVELSIGPDAAIYIADWSNPIVAHYQVSYGDPARDKSHGRIWRVTAKDVVFPAKVALERLGPYELLEQLRAPEQWTRDQAKRRLFDGDSAEVLPAARAWWRGLRADDPLRGRLLMDVLGVFQAYEAPEPELLAALLESNDPRVRAYGCRAIGDWAPALPNAYEWLARAVGDAHPRVRLEAVIACSEIRTADSAALAVRVIDHPRDRFIDYALAQTLRALQPAWAPELAAGRFAAGAIAPYREVFLRITQREAVFEPPGKKIYDALCLNCHQPDAMGLGEIYPPLGRSSWMRGDKTTLIRVLLHGLTGPIKVGGRTFGTNGVPMPAVPLDDQQIADVLTYIRGNFGNNFDAVSVDLVRQVRAADAGRTLPWTEAELRGTDPKRSP